MGAGRLGQARQVGQVEGVVRAAGWNLRLRRTNPTAEFSGPGRGYGLELRRDGLQLGRVWKNRDGSRDFVHTDLVVFR